MEDEYSWDEYLSPSQYAAVHHCPVFVVFAQIKAGYLPYIIDSDGSIRIRVTYKVRL